MITRGKIKSFTLRVLHRMAGTPMPESALLQEVGQGFAPEPPRAEILTVIKELEEAGLIAGVRDEITDILTWTLTTVGQHKAQQLG